MDTFSTMDSFEQMICKKASFNEIPITGAIELLPLCNMNCDMCYIRLSKEEAEKISKIMTADEWIEVAKQMKEAGTLFVLLTGGEPFLYKDFKKVYNALKNMGIIITINTNGTLIDEEIANMLKKNKPRRVNVTLYGASNEAYADICKNPKGFDQTINAIRLLKERNIDVKMNVSLIEKNKNELPLMFEIAHKLDVPIDVDTYMYPKTKGTKSDFDLQCRLNPKEAANIDIAIRYNTETEKSFMKNRIDFLNKYEYAKYVKPPQQIPMQCRAGKSSFWIDWKGNVTPCVFMENISINVFENDFSKCWKYIVKESKKLFMPKECVLCDKREICQVCMATVYCENGNFKKAPKYLCDFTEEMIEILK